MHFQGLMYNSCHCFVPFVVSWCTPTITNLQTMWSSCSFNTDSLFILQQFSRLLPLEQSALPADLANVLHDYFSGSAICCMPNRYIQMLGLVKALSKQHLFARDQEWPPFTIVYHKNCLCYIACSWEKKWNNTAKCQSCQDTQSKFIVTEIMETCT